MTARILLCDLKENLDLRLALVRPGERPDAVTSTFCKNYAGFFDALKQLLSDNGNPDLVGAAISAPGWDHEGQMRLTHIGFNILRDDVRRHLGVSRVNLVNDFVAKALAIPHLRDEEVDKISGEVCGLDQVKAVIGPGGGLGVSALIPDGLGHYSALPTEGGHSDLAATTVRECEIVNALVARFGHVSRERVLSFSGLGLLYETLCRLDGQELMLRPSISSLINLADNGDHLAEEAIDLFNGWLAALASDCALLMGARGGIYLSGDVIEALGERFDRDRFVKRFREKGRMSDYVNDVPVYQTRAKDIILIGLSSLFEDAQSGPMMLDAC